MVYLPTFTINIFTYIWLIFMVNVGTYTIHGSYGIGKVTFFRVKLLNLGRVPKNGGILNPLSSAIFGAPLHFCCIHTALYRYLHFRYLKCLGIHCFINILHSQYTLYVADSTQLKNMIANMAQIRF